MESNFKLNLISVITQVLPNIKWKDLSRLVAQLEIELPNLRELQEAEDGEKEKA